MLSADDAAFFLRPRASYCAYNGVTPAAAPNLALRRKTIIR